MTLADFCAGTGAFSLAFEKLGFKTVYANDIESSSKKIFDANISSIELDCRDIHDIDALTLPDFDILTAGFPCQPFSIAGQKMGFADSRSNVFWKLLEIMSIKKPSIIVLENVKNLETHDDGNTFKIITNSLEKLGYHLKYKILETSKLTGIPHHRERIYIVGFLNKDLCERFNFPQKNKKIRNMANFIESDINDQYIYTSKSAIYEKLKKDVIIDVNENNTVYQYRRCYVRQNKNGVCPTLTCSMGVGGHNTPIIKLNDIIRKFTPRECFNLQGFPKNYILPKLSNSKLYKLAGNAVTYKIVKYIAKQIYDILPDG